MTLNKSDAAYVKTPAQDLQEVEFDMTSVKEASSFSKLGIIIGVMLLTMLFFVSLSKAPSDSAVAEVELEVAADAVEEAMSAADAAANVDEMEGAMSAADAAANVDEIEGAMNAADWMKAADATTKIDAAANAADNLDADAM